jgi:type II secretory pathway predicted ATPase ExeA
MLTEHFKLGMQPFGATPDPKFLYLSQTHREALASLFYAIHSGRGFAALIAPPGMGKTTLLTHLLGLLMPTSQTAFLFQTLCGPEDFLRFLLADLGIENKGDMACMHANLDAYLLQQSKNGRKVVVIIDEAQNLDDRVLELVRMLSNFETPSNKLMQLVLSGQPQLAQRLASEHLVQLRQRISIIAKLSPLDADETREYIDHRLRVAGAASAKSIFSKAAYEMLAEHSCGIPRNINNLCFNSMSLACALKRSNVEALMVQEAINDLDLRPLVVREHSQHVTASSRTFRVDAVLPPPVRRRMPLAIGLLILVVCIGGLVSAAWQHSFVSRAAMSSGQHEMGSVVDAAHVRAEENKQTEQGKEKVPASALIPDESLEIAAASESKNHRNSNHRRSERTRTTPDVSVEFGELPLPLINFERLLSWRITEFSDHRQILEQMQAPSEKVFVPFELAAQREKR